MRDETACTIRLVVMVVITGISWENAQNVFMTI